MTAKVVPLFGFMVALVLLPYSVTAGSGCYDALDIVQVQDVTSSFNPFWPNLIAKAGTAITDLKDQVPDLYFGVVSFKDKNISGYNKNTKKTVTLGDSTDYCLRVDSRLQRADSRQMVRLFQRFQSANPVDGGDSFAGVFEAIYRAVTASNLRWRLEPLGGKHVGRYIIAVTGAPSHLQDDVFKLTGTRLPTFDITPYTIRDNRHNENYNCDKVEYPSLEQLRDFLTELDDTTVMILVAPSGTTDSKGKFEPYQSVAALGREYQTEDGLVRWYRKLLSDAGLSRVQVRTLDSEMLRYGEVFEGIARDFNHAGCRPPVN